MCIAGEKIFYILCVLGPFGRVLVGRARWLFFLGCVVLGVAGYASLNPGLVFSLPAGRKRVDENAHCNLSLFLLMPGQVLYSDSMYAAYPYSGGLIFQSRLRNSA
jgi:hypothetical protein